MKTATIPEIHKCPICEQVFDGSEAEVNYADHLQSHITAFEQAWNEK
jgi:hypothetical protein